MDFIEQFFIKILIPKEQLHAVFIFLKTKYSFDD